VKHGRALRRTKSGKAFNRKVRKEKSAKIAKKNWKVLFLASFADFLCDLCG
jgi:hypothetical protein